METAATVYYTRFESDENARGTLFLLDDGSVVFVTKRLLVFGYERHHGYDKGQILKVETYSDGFKAHVLFPESGDEPEEVISYFYEIERDVDRWAAALSRAPEQPKRVDAVPATTSQPIEVKPQALDWIGEVEPEKESGPSVTNAAVSSMKRKTGAITAVQSEFLTQLRSKLDEHLMPHARSVRKLAGYLLGFAVLSLLAVFALLFLAVNEYLIGLWSLSALVALFSGLAFANYGIAQATPAEQEAAENFWKRNSDLSSIIWYNKSA